MQRSLNGGGVPVENAPGLYDDYFGDFVDNTPRLVAIVIVGAALTLFFLTRAGFRFNFGVGANIGK